MGLALVEALRDRAGRRFECLGGAVHFEVFFDVNAATVVASVNVKVRVFDEVFASRVGQAVL